MRGQLIEAEHLARYWWVARLASGRRVLDAGCGTAYGSEILAQAGADEVVGVDLDADVIEEARDSVSDSVSLLVGDAQELPLEDSSFDLVVCFELIEHVEEPGSILDELRRVVRPEESLRFLRRTGTSTHPEIRTTGASWCPTSSRKNSGDASRR